MDDVLIEVRKVREAYSRQFGHDLAAIHRDLKEQERASGRRIVSLPPRRPRQAPMKGNDSWEKGAGQVGDVESMVGR